MFSLLKCLILITAEKYNERSGKLMVHPGTISRHCNFSFLISGADTTSIVDRIMAIFRRKTWKESVKILDPFIMVNQTISCVPLQLDRYIIYSYVCVCVYAYIVYIHTYIVEWKQNREGDFLNMIKESRIYRYILSVLNSLSLYFVNLPQFISHKEFAMDRLNAGI